MILCRFGPFVNEARVWWSWSLLIGFWWVAQRRSVGVGAEFQAWPRSNTPVGKKPSGVPLRSCPCWTLAATLERLNAAGWEFIPGSGWRLRSLRCILGIFLSIFGLNRRDPPLLGEWGWGTSHRPPPREDGREAGSLMLALSFKTSVVEIGGEEWKETEHQ